MESPQEGDPCAGKPQRSIFEYVGILDGPEIDIQALRDEWAERTDALDNQAEHRPFPPFA